LGTRQSRATELVQLAMAIYFSVRAANGIDSSKEKPNFAAGGAGGRGSAKPGLAWF
jgi:hypothetical protein